MEFVGRAVDAAVSIASRNGVINVFLAGSFTALCIRSANQQREIEALESQKESLVKTNKAMKKTIWDWKQQLYAEASNVESAIVPLARLKAIYGEVVTPQTSDTVKKDPKSPATRIVI